MMRLIGRVVLLRVRMRMWMRLPVRVPMRVEFLLQMAFLVLTLRLVSGEGGSM
jgi:hypothetical protein